MTVELATRTQLRELAIVPVADAAARDAIAPRPLGMRVHRLDSGMIEGWTGTAWLVVPPADLIADIAAAETAIAALQADVATRVRKLFQASGLSTTSTGDVTLASYSVPGNTLAVNGQALRVTLTGQIATQGGVLTFLFGATTVWSAALTAGDQFVIDITLVRTGPTTQVSHVVQVKSTSVLNVFRSAPAETLSGAVLLDFKGRVTAGGTLTFDGVGVELLAA